MPDCVECPDECANDKQDVERGEDIIFETELDWCESEVENEIEGKRQGHDPRNLLGKCLIKHRAKRDGDNCI